MAFGPKAGCPMCDIVATAVSASDARPEILWRDDNFTAYCEHVYPVSSKAHIIIAFNLHVPSLYTLASSDLPLLINIRNVARCLLTSSSDGQDDAQFHIGFITPPFRDNKIPVSDHLHAHAYIAPADRLGWWRGVAYGPLAWYAVDDLIAEMRQSVFNNRVKSSHENRKNIPVTRTGAVNGYEFTAVSDVERGGNKISSRT